MHSTRGEAASQAPLSTPTVPDRQLVARILSGDRVACRALYDAHAAGIHRLAFRLTGDAALAEDCTQEAFIRAFDRMASFRGDASLRTWLYRIAVTVTLNAIRKRRRWLQREEELDELLLPPARSRGPDPDLRERLTRAIEALPEIYRLVVVMHDVEEYTHAEIGEILGIPEGTSKARLSVARRRLREALADFAGN